MRKTTLLHFCGFIAMIGASLPAFCQGSRFDIALEGPWIFYQEKNLIVTTVPGSASQPYSALIAIAPVVPGHSSLSFSTGSGGTLPPGIYCIGFDGKDCAEPQTANLGISYDPYAQPTFIPVKMPKDWDWRESATSKVATYVLILPLPNSWSSDGQYLYSLAGTFPDTTQPLPSNTTTNFYSIGVQLHYDLSKKPAVVVQNFNLYNCITGVQAAASVNCDSRPYPPSPQTNSGTLRIHIKSDETKVTQPECDHHVHRAYSYMTKVLGLQPNDPNRYLFDDYTWTVDCLVCDPQQEKIPSDCSVGTAMSQTVTVKDLVKALEAVIKNLNADEDSPRCPGRAEYELCGLEDTEGQINRTGISDTVLYRLRQQIMDSRKAIDIVLGGHVTMSSHVFAKTTNDLRSASNDELLVLRQIRVVLMDGGGGDSGKDCRAPGIMVTQ